MARTGSPRRHPSITRDASAMRRNKIRNPARPRKTYARKWPYQKEDNRFRPEGVPFYDRDAPRSKMGDSPLHWSLGREGYAAPSEIGDPKSRQCAIRHSPASTRPDIMGFCVSGATAPSRRQRHFVRAESPPIEEKSTPTGHILKSAVSFARADFRAVRPRRTPD